MVDIYCIIEKKKKGPYSVAELISQLQLSEVKEETLSWHKGCSDWMPLCELPAMQEYFVEAARTGDKQDQPEAEEQLMQEQDDPSQKSQDDTLIVEQARSESSAAPEVDASAMPPSGQMAKLYMPTPIQRFFARMIDYSFYLLFYSSVIFILSIPFSPDLLPVNPMLWVPTIFFEAVLISVFRTTVGKKIMGIRIFSLSPQEPFTFRRSVVRAMMVFTFGMGLMLFAFPILPLPLIAMGVAYWKLRKPGISMWDMRAVSIPLQKSPASIFSYFFACCLILVNLEITVRCFQPWLPALNAFVHEQSEALEGILPDFILNKTLPIDEEEVEQGN